MNDDLNTSLPFASKELLAHALEALAKTAELRGSIVKHQSPAEPNYKVDEAVEIESSFRTYRYLVECKFKVDRKALLDQIYQRQKQWDGLLLFVRHRSA